MYVDIKSLVAHQDYPVFYVTRNSESNFWIERYSQEQSTRSIHVDYQPKTRLFGQLLKQLYVRENLKEQSPRKQDMGFENKYCCWLLDWMAPRQIRMFPDDRLDRNIPLFPWIKFQ